MKPEDITFAFENGKTFAIHEGKVIAAHEDSDVVERMVKDIVDGGDDGFKENLPPAVGHTVTTPNGLKGTVLGKVAGLWSDEVTVRLENGRIVKLPVSDELRFASTRVASTTSPIEELENRLAATPDGTFASLEARIKELRDIKNRVGSLVREASMADQERLDVIRLTADMETAEVNDAIAYLNDEADNAFRPPAPAFSINPVEQESMGGHGGEWLDNTVNEMIAEAESQDFGKIMDEGPESFAAGLDDAAIGDAGAVRSMASSYISEKTAGTDPDARKPYMDTWIARVEQCRRNELATRKSTVHKEAAAEESIDFSGMPDEFLW